MFWMLWMFWLECMPEKKVSAPGHSQFHPAAIFLDKKLPMSAMQTSDMVKTTT